MVLGIGWWHGVARVACNKTCREARRPPEIMQRSCIVPLSCGPGDSSVVDAASPSVIRPSQGISASGMAASTRAMLGLE